MFVVHQFVYTCLLLARSTCLLINLIMYYFIHTIFFYVILGCHGVNTNTEHRYREKKNGFTEWTENTTVYKPPLVSQYHWLYTIPYKLANSIYCVFIAGVEFRRESPNRLDSQETPVKFMYGKSTWDWKCCLSTWSAHQFNTCDRGNNN